MVTTTGDGIGKLHLYDWRGALAFQYLQTGTNDACVACQRAYTTYAYDGEGHLDHRLLLPGVAVMPYTETSGVLTRQPTLFLHTDHLGSTAAVTTDDDPGPGLNAVVKERRSYDAFGLQRHPDWRSHSYTDIPAALTTQGYTGHTDAPDLGLIDMKGRVYDPTLARFLTPDPFVSDPGATQPWNPYAYVRNNPLRYTDPSGFEECVGCEEFWGAGEAFWEGGTGGLNAYSHGALDREAERFINKHYKVRRDEGLWGDAQRAQLKQHGE